MKLINELFFLFDHREKRWLLLLLIATSLGAALETLGIGLLVPFFQFVIQPDSFLSRLDQHSWLRVLKNFLELPEPALRPFLFGSLISILFIVKNIYLLMLSYAQNKYLYDRMLKLSKVLLSSYFNEPYSFFLNRNSSALLVNVNRVGVIFTGVVMPLMAAMVEVCVVVFIALLMLKVSYQATLLAFFTLFPTTFLVYRMSQKKLRDLSSIREQAADDLNRWLTQGLQGIKEVKVLGCENYFLNAFTKNSKISFDLSVVAQTAAIAPKFFVEAFAVVVLVLTLSLLMMKGIDLQASLPQIGLFLVAAARLMPSFTRIFAQLSLVRHSRAAVSLVVRDLRESAQVRLERKNESHEHPFTLQKSISVKHVSFNYGQKSILELADFEIKKGEVIGLVGPSGSGKTTLVDLILGLLDPQAGQILVDGQDIQNDKKSWLKKIGYIPQHIYLIDESIRKNVAFGLEENEIEDKKVWAALEAAQLLDFVRSLPEQIETSVGDRGVRLSGGQRQRLGIARALYHNPEFLVLDEATSALDEATEREVTESIESISKNKTMLVIAHRLSTLKKCHRICRVENGKIVS